MNYIFQVDPKLVLYSSDKIVVAADTERPNHTGHRSHTLFANRDEPLEIGNGVLGLYATWNAEKLERVLGVNPVRARFVTYVNKNGPSFEEVSQAIVLASRKEDELLERWRNQASAHKYMDDLIARSFGGEVLSFS